MDGLGYVSGVAREMENEMNFTWWLVKRAWKPVREAWNEDVPNRIMMCCMSAVFVLVFDVIFDLVFYNNNDGQIKYYVLTILWFVGWLLISSYQLGKYTVKLYAQYRAERPEQEKPKRKWKNDYDEQLEAMTDHYISIVDGGLNLFDFKPERPTGEMAGNRYAQDAYTKQLIAFSRAVGINSENKEYFEEGGGE